MDKIRLTPEEITRILSAFEYAQFFTTTVGSLCFEYIKLQEKFEAIVKHWGPSQAWIMQPDGLTTQSQQFMATYNCRCGHSTPTFEEKSVCTSCGASFEILPNARKEDD